MVHQLEKNILYFIILQSSIQYLMCEEVPLLEVRDLAQELYVNGIQTIVFAKSRVRVEMLVTYLKALVSKKIR